MFTMADEILHLWKHQLSTVIFAVLYIPRNKRVNHPSIHICMNAKYKYYIIISLLNFSVNLSIYTVLFYHLYICIDINKYFNVPNIYYIRTRWAHFVGLICFHNATCQTSVNTLWPTMFFSWQGIFIPHVYPQIK